MEAQAHLADILANSGAGVTQQAFEMYKQAALQGHARSQYNLGTCFRNGRACERSHERAVEWWAKAAEQGHAAAQCELGYAHVTGQGVRRSAERGLELFKLSAAQGYATAFAGLGMCYYDGNGVDQSFAEARRLYELAVARGQARVALPFLQRLDDGTQQHCPLLSQPVVLRGLNTAALNGARGTAVDFGYSKRNPGDGGWCTDSGRYTVRLDGPEGRLIKVRVANVEGE